MRNDDESFESLTIIIINITRNTYKQKKHNSKGN